MKSAAFFVLKKFPRIASENWTSGKKRVEVIHAQEQALIFEKFTNEDTYQIGTKIKQAAEMLGHGAAEKSSAGH